MPDPQQQEDLINHPAAIPQGVPPMLARDPSDDGTGWQGFANADVANSPGAQALGKIGGVLNQFNPFADQDAQSGVLNQFTAAPATTPAPGPSPVTPATTSAQPGASVVTPSTVAPQPGVPPMLARDPQPVLQPHEKKALQAVGEKYGKNAIGPDGLINTEIIKNDLANLAMDDQKKATAMKAVYDANDHVKAMSAIGAQQARDASGADYWQNASTGMKILRVLGGIVTLGGSEHAIRAQINAKVASDEKDKTDEDNTYKAMIEAGKTREQALSIDYAKQAHIYALGLDRIGAAHPSPVVQDRIAALKTEMQKETSLALLSHYKQQQENSVSQQNANTSRFNAQTERMKAEAEKIKAGKPNAATVIRDANGNIIGNSDTPDQAKQIQAQQLSVASLDQMASRVNSYSWTDKFTPSARAAAAADYSQIMQLVNSYRAAHPNEESSRQMEVLQKSIPNPSDLTTSPAAYRTGFGRLVGDMKASLVLAKKTSGL